MTISNEAVEAAAKASSDANYELAWTALPDWVKEQQRKDARRHLEAAAPFVRAEALEAAAIELLSDESAPPKSFKEMYNAIYATWLSERAAAARSES